MCLVAHLFVFLSLDQVVDLVGGGPVIDGPTPSSLFKLNRMAMLIAYRPTAKSNSINIRLVPRQKFRSFLKHPV